MAQEVLIAGALFSNVPSIRVPDSNDTYHPFVDPSVTTATASDVATGKVFIAADGTQTTGTGITPSGTISITSNGTHDVTAYASASVNVSSSGGASWVEQLSGSVNVENFGLIDYVSSASTVWCATFFGVEGEDANGDTLAMTGLFSGSQTFEVYGKGDFVNYGGEGGSAALLDNVNTMPWVLVFENGGPNVWPALSDNGGSPLLITGGHVTSFKILQ